MEDDYSKINRFTKGLNDFRETMNVGDFFFTPYITHINRLIPHDGSGIHEQPCYEISFLLAGKITYRIDSAEVTLLPGDIVIIPPKRRHGWTIHEQYADVFNFMIHISTRGDRSRKNLEELNHSVRRFHYSLRQFSSFEKIIRAMMDEALEQKIGCRLKFILLLKILLIEFVRQLLPNRASDPDSRNLPPARETVNDIVSLVSYYLQDNIDRPISLRELSRHLGFSVGHLNCLYKKATGTTVHQAIINKRLEYGCRYLKRTDRQVKDIAAMVGYEDVNYFYLQFRKKYHMTPSEYRKKHHPGES